MAEEASGVDRPGLRNGIADPISPTARCSSGASGKSHAGPARRSSQLAPPVPIMGGRDAAPRRLCRRRDEQMTSNNPLRPQGVPLALKVGYGAATPVIAAVYARCYGVANFLWLSDIALGLTTVAVLTETALPASIAAVAVLPLEIAWNADVLTGGRLTGLAGYMFDRKLPLWLRALSLFHVALPPTLLWQLRKFGYDRRALAIQCGITWTVLPLTYALTDPAKNINWAFGPGTQPQKRLPPFLYLALAMLAFPLLVHWPTHRAMQRLFGRCGDRG